MGGLQAKRVIVVGLGDSGVAAAKLALSQGARLTITDSAPVDRLSLEARALDAKLVAGGHGAVSFEQADLVVVSPGVPPLAEIESAQAEGVEVVSEIEFACRFLSAPILCVGGTNGKSTVTTLLGGMLGASGFDVFVGGNLGTPLSAAVGKQFDALVVEVSSFQLERVTSFQPRVSVLLNIAEDHLDRYPSFLAYAEAKGNAFVNQTRQDVAVAPQDDGECIRQARRGRAELVTFGARGDYFVESGAVIERRTGDHYALGQTELCGGHNHENAAAAIAAARSFGVQPEPIRRGLSQFSALPHRMQRVAAYRGVTYYDDSKATNVAAAVTAVRGLSEARGVFILGGRDKGGSYEPLAEALARKGRASVLLGEAAERIAAALNGHCPVHRAASMEGAVRLASELARPGDAVLLSPACSSFDMYESYAERGRSFQQAVQRLGESTTQEVTG